MGTKILKVGSNVMTLNNEVVSVKETYPYWKVNADMYSQYYNALKEELYPTNVFSGGVGLDVPAIQVAHNTGSYYHYGLIMAPNGSMYSVPNSAYTILKITPNPSNYQSPTITNIGNFGTTIAKWVGAHLVGDYIIYTPSTATNIMVLDTRTDTITTFGNFAGTTKWGAGALTDDGRIFCPPYTSTDWLIIDVNDPTNITTSLVPALTGNQAGATYVNGVVYSHHFYGNNANYSIKIDTTTLIDSAIPNMSGNTYGSIGFCSPFHHNGSLFYITSSGAHAYNVSSGSISFINTVPYGLGAWASPVQCADGWLYYSHFSASYARFRINPENFTLQYSQSLTSSYAGSGGAMDYDGRIYNINGVGFVNIFNTSITGTMTQDRILSRYHKNI